MGKKAQAEVWGVVITAVIVFTVIVISAIIIYTLFLGPNASPNWFLNAINQFKYPKEWKDANDIQADVNGLLNCNGNADEIKSRIATLQGVLSEDAEYILNRITQLNAEADINANYCKATKELNALSFDGVNEADFKSKLQSVKNAFNDISKMERFQAGILAKEKVDLINKILKPCDFNDKEKDKCSPQNTNNYCVWIAEKNDCKTAVCAKADESTCKQIVKDAKFCYPSYKVYTQGTGVGFSSCKSCIEMQCEDYANENECNFDFCNKANCERYIPTEYPSNIPETGACRTKGGPTLSLCKRLDGKKEECERTEGCIYLYRAGDGSREVCVPCQNSLADCNQILSPDSSYSFDQFKHDCNGLLSCSNNCEVRVRVTGLDDASSQYVGENRKTSFYGLWNDCADNTLPKDYCVPQRMTCCGETDCPLSPAISR